jgi:hypothetical protein
MRSRFRNALGIVLFWAVAVFAESLRLKDGSRLEGKRVRVEDSTLIFRTLDLGELRVPLSAVEDEAASASAEVSADESARKKGEWSDPSGQALFFLPTAGPRAAEAVRRRGARSRRAVGPGRVRLE